MSIPGSLTPLFSTGAGGAAGYQIERSLRFNSSDSGFCSRTPAVAGNRKTWTWAGWVKRSALGSNSRVLFGTGNAGNDGAAIRFNGSDQLEVYEYLSGSFYYNLISTQVFRDPSSFGHLVVSVDTSQATSSNRIKIYWNGSQITAFGTSTYPSSDYLGEINTAVVHGIGRGGSYNDLYFSGYLADIHFIDGQALTPSSFTEVSATTGQLIPKAYTGSFGTNGFWLKFSDNSAATAAALGKDYSGNNNDWTPNNLSVTAGAGNDSLLDTPTSYGTDTGVGGEVRGNYCTLNPLAALSFATLSNGNLDVALNGSASYAIGVRGTIAIPTSDKWYWEVTVTSVGELGIGVIDFQSGIRSYYYRYDDGGWQNIYINDVQTAAVVGYTNNDVIGIGYDADNSQIRWYKNGTQVGTNYSLTNNGRFVPHINHGSFSGSAAAVTNFGQRAFAYTAPSGFKALCDTNLGAPLVAKPNTVMDVVLYTGTGASLTPTSSLGFNPDWIWIKSRSAATDHALYDVVRGAQARLESNTTDAEVTTDGGVTAFNSAGFTLGTLAQVNTSSATYAAWCWDAGTSTVSNTAGSITSQVRANVSAGFSVVTYTGTGSSATVGHGLGVASKFFIIKRRNSASSWIAWHSAIGVSDILRLESTNATQTISGFWQGTNPSSTILYLDADGTVNASGSTYVAYCFSPVVGYSAALAWTGNGSNDGTMIYCGFSPRFWIFKRTDTTGDWWMIDTARSNTGNPVDEWLAANRSDAEYPNDGDFDFLSNGIKIRTTSTTVNASGGSYIGYAWASNPFQYARAQ